MRLHRRISFLLSLICTLFSTIFCMSCIDTSRFPSTTQETTKSNNEKNKVIELNAESIFLQINSSFQLNVLNESELNLKEGVEVYYSWGSENTSIAVVFEGNVVGTGIGETNIVVVDSENRRGECKVVVGDMSDEEAQNISLGENTGINTDVSSVSLNVHDYVLNKGQKYKLYASISPVEAKMNMITYKSTNSAIVDVYNDGTMIAKSSGTATIVVLVGTKSDTCNVTVPDDSIQLNSFTLDKESIVIDGYKPEYIYYNWQANVTIPSVYVDYKAYDSKGKEISLDQKANITFFSAKQTIYIEPLSASYFKLNFTCLNLNKECTITIKDTDKEASIYSNSVGIMSGTFFELIVRMESLYNLPGGGNINYRCLNVRFSSNFDYLKDTKRQDVRKLDFNLDGRMLSYISKTNNSDGTVFFYINIKLTNGTKNDSIKYYFCLAWGTSEQNPATPSNLISAFSIPVYKAPKIF